MLYLGILDLHETNYTYLWRIFLVAVKKAITHKWLRLNPPTLEEWKAIVIETCKMETLTVSLELKKQNEAILWSMWEKKLDSEN